MTNKLNNIPKNLLLEIKDRKLYFNNKHVENASYEVLYSTPYDDQSTSGRIRIEIDVPSDSFIFKKGTQAFKDFLFSYNLKDI